MAGRTYRVGRRVKKGRKKVTQRKSYYQQVKTGARHSIRGKGNYRTSYRTPRSYIRGQGRYRFPKGLLRAGGGLLGAAAGAYLGTAIAPGIGTIAGTKLGGLFGRDVGSVLGRIVGSGDYTVKRNSIMYPDMVVPSFGEDSIRVKKREFVCEINATQNFQNNSFDINPGLSEVFPWLSAIAQNYEQYRFNGLVFQFVSLSSDAIASSTNLGMGQVIMATDYDSKDSAFVNSPQMLGSMFSNSCKVSENMMHAVECAPTEQQQKLYYTRTGDVPSGADQRLYDLGVFQIATDKFQADFEGCGQLWVSYDITFTKSQMNNQLGFGLNTDQYLLVAPSSSNNFGTSRSVKENSNLGITFPDANSFAFPPTLQSGYYLVNYAAYGSSTAVTNFSIAVTNGEVLNVFNNSTGYLVSNGGTTSVSFEAYFLVRIKARDCVVTLTGGTKPSSPTYGDLLVTQVNGELYLNDVAPG